ncbi:MAG: hypothetical protein KTR35_10690 [Gammaproteobacteria bacterium]|nr:hypothetical protein [Gammaproteobacteria bacterium]
MSRTNVNKPLMYGTIAILSLATYALWLQGHNLGSLTLALASVALLHLSFQRTEIVEPPKFSFAPLSSLDDSYSELQELQRSLCRLEIDLEKDLADLARLDANSDPKVQG